MNKIELKPITLSEEYQKKWNVAMRDFVGLFINGERVNDCIYRIGGFNAIKGKYLLLIKHIEAQYDERITKDPERQKHLAGHWCIVDNNGNEKFVADAHEYIYIHGQSVFSTSLFNNASNYYLIETGKFICTAYSTMKSENYILLDNAYDDDHSKRGIFKVHKTTGEIELIQ